MTGNNEMRLNQETINKAIEYWLNETQMQECSQVCVMKVAVCLTGPKPVFVVEFAEAGEDEKELSSEDS